MLKNLRNRMLFINMVSTFLLLVISFCVIFAVTYSSVRRDIDRSLFRAFVFHRTAEQSTDAKKPMFPPPDEESGGKPNENGDRHLGDIRNFSVLVSQSGEVNTDSVFGENNGLYEAVAKRAAAQKEEKGSFKSDGVYWQYDTRSLKDGARLIALADVTAEYNMLARFIISFIICAALLLVLIFFFSLYFANRAMRPVIEAWEKQKQFVSDASHELKTPLAAINTNVDAVLANPESSVLSQEKWLNYIKSESQRLALLTGNRLDNQAEFKTESVNLSEITEQAVLNLEAAAFERQVRFDYSIEKDVTVTGAKDQLQRLAVILLDNAVKYSPDRGTVNVSLKKKDKHAELSVHNTGEPIPPDEQEKIFDRFYRVDKARSAGSYGLGLSMARDIVRLHGGKIWVESSKENGTSFFVTV